MDFTIDTIECAFINGADPSGNKYTIQVCVPEAACDVGDVDDDFSWIVKCPENAVKVLLSTSMAILATIYSI